ncbi:MAG: 1-deoxy-D-xylulose-5-phosphate synthase [Bacteroidetes bacterium]|jgi:1-deoxy-D-xylulose-5-phosphate synthase|nr:1-deoxy-D-xylulose-5-phosphate synthase [Bacteroidota bacterium]MBT4410446.1 1-deoxy-D-xylulose-5-phosphate synthase [Bacteroidota bacterium]MBT5427067.1 1-deoxy-D-xylulose-5-phosphate synthase [Bacteroidota bacterium]MBT7095078.1 1-deoxy-D-xylulose-5-phosphate synthase [Bacteroidota bacterium]MBT7462477.1 1-deoxy-D-xylulose-5-phosphate synthase [Bacteroidota bacterium]
MEEKSYALLESINCPDDLKKLKTDDLISVCSELRDFIIDEVSHNPGHFGASLGVVELTVALHYAFKTPYDNLIWDVGHQAYGHKILTGRRDQFYSNRKFKGISGFPKMSESEYDAFGTGHSSTSISAALGMAVAADRKNETDRQTVAIIGDGALTGGMAFEGLNNAGIERSNILVILNDNNMAIDPSRGAIKEYLLDITTSRSYNRFRDDTWKILGKLSKIGPGTRRLVQTLENAIKHMILKQSNLFESMNFRYFGPVDGHDVIHLTKILADLKNIRGPKLLHVVTKKGKGFKQAEINQTAFHAPGLFDKRTGELIKSEKKDVPPKFQDVFGYTLLELAEKNDKIVGVTPAMPSGSSLNIMMKKMPERTFDVGIAEQHAVTFSAGMAAQGLIPFCNIYSSFIQRAYDQVIHDVALQKLPVVFCLDRAGLVGSDGPTHHGAFDLSFFRLVPNLTIASPMDEIELRNMMFTAQLQNQGPFVIRYPRGNGIHLDWKKPFMEISVGKGRLLREGKKIAVLSIGTTGILVSTALDKLAEENIHPAHYDLRFLKPLDEKLLQDIFQQYDHIITVEDASILGGFGSAVIEAKETFKASCTVKRMGIPDEFIEHGTQNELYELCGYNSESIANTIRSLV